MRTLQINYSDHGDGGGGAIALHRLCQGLTQIGVDCNVLSRLKTLDSDHTAQIPRWRWLEEALKQLTQPLGLNDLHTLGSFRLRQHPFFQAADVINAHVIHSNYFNYLALPSLAAQRPTLLTLHDMWAFTGHCAYSYDCSRWQTGCGQCPYPHTYPPIQHDNTHLEWQLKCWVYHRANLTIVAPSRWLADQAKKSLLGHYSIHHIPNGLDTDVYTPLDKTLARQALGLPLDQYIVMGCAERLDDHRKGMDLLVASLNQLPEPIKANTLLLLLGQRSQSIEKVVQVPIVSLGYVSSDRLKALAYAAADVFLFPTRADNLPIVLQESMACGTPMVSFAVGGVPDLVRPDVTGLLARPDDLDDFTRQVVALLTNPNYRQTLAHRCREIAIQDYSLSLQAQRYKNLYESLVDDRR